MPHSKPQAPAAFVAAVKSITTKFKGTGTLYNAFFVLQKIADGKTAKQIIDYEETSDQFIGYTKTYFTEKLTCFKVGFRGTEVGRTNKCKIAIMIGIFRAHEATPAQFQKTAIEAASEFIASEIAKVLNQKPMIIGKGTFASVPAFIRGIDQAAAAHGNENRLGDIWQYVIAAKLCHAGLIAKDSIENANANDTATGRRGDFELDGRIIHVTLGGFSKRDLQHKITTHSEVRHVVITSGEHKSKIAAEIRGAPVLSLEDFFEANSLERAAKLSDYLSAIITQYNLIINHVDAPSALLMEIVNTAHVPAQETRLLP